MAGLSFKILFEKKSPGALVHRSLAYDWVVPIARGLSDPQESEHEVWLVRPLKPPPAIYNLLGNVLFQNNFST